MIERDSPLRDAADLEVDRAWREMSHEEPSAGVDEAIRAAARRESATGATREPARPTPERIGGTPGWLRLATAAGIAAVAFGLIRLQQPPTEPADIEQSSTMPRPGPPGESDTTGANRQEEAARPERERSYVAPPPDADALEAPAAPPAPPGSFAPGGPASTAASAGTAATAAEASRATAAGESALPPPDASVSPEDFVVRIRSLLEHGDQDGAAAALLAFRAANPGADALLPADLRDWAAGIPHD